MDFGFTFNCPLKCHFKIKWKALQLMQGSEKCETLSRIYTLALPFTQNQLTLCLCKAMCFASIPRLSSSLPRHWRQHIVVAGPRPDQSEGHGMGLILPCIHVSCGIRQTYPYQKRVKYNGKQHLIQHQLAYLDILVRILIFVQAKFKGC